MKVVFLVFIHFYLTLKCYESGCSWLLLHFVSSASLITYVKVIPAYGTQVSFLFQSAF